MNTTDPITRTVENDRIRRTYQAFKYDGDVYISVLEESGGEITVNDTHGYRLADDDETVVHCGMQWEEYALERFKRLNDARFRHEFTDLIGAI